MAKRKIEWNQEKLNRFLREGRGQGEGKEYKPWHKVQDFPSMGRCSRIFGLKTNRVHHLFSDVETNFFYLMQWEDMVIDVRESFPLLDLQEILEDERDLRLDLFKDKESGLSYVLTTSFLLTVNDGNKNKYIARSIKAASELDKKITIEKYEIEKRYWKIKGIDWAIVTQKEIPKIKVKNIEWVYSALDSVGERGLSEAEIQETGDLLIDAMMSSSRSLRSVMNHFDKEYNLQQGSALFIFKYLIASKTIIVNMEEEIDINATGKEIIIERKNREEKSYVVGS